MNASQPLGHAQRLFAESGLASSHEPADVAVVEDLLDRHYDLGGRLRPLATEKDDTFRLTTGAIDHLVKVSPPDEAQAVVGLQPAAMRFLERAAPGLPVQRVKLTVDGSDSVVIDAHDGTSRVLRVFDFVQGALWAPTNPDGEQLAKVGETLGRVDVALESFAHPADQRGLVWDIRHFHQLTELVEHTPNAAHRQLAERVFRLFEATIVPMLDDLETQVIHGDYSPYNVVVDELSDDYVAGVIDFGDTVRSAVIFDPAVAVANLVGARARSTLAGRLRLRCRLRAGAADQGSRAAAAPGRRAGTTHPARADHPLARGARTRTPRLPPGPCQGRLGQRGPGHGRTTDERSRAAAQPPVVR